MTTEYTVETKHTVTIDGKEVAEKIQSIMNKVVEYAHVDPNIFYRELQYLYLDGVRRGLQLASGNSYNYVQQDKVSEMPDVDKLTEL